MFSDISGCQAEPFGVCVASFQLVGSQISQPLFEIILSDFIAAIGFGSAGRKRETSYQSQLYDNDSKPTNTKHRFLLGHQSNVFSAFFSA